MVWLQPHLSALCNSSLLSSPPTKRGDSSDAGTRQQVNCVNRECSPFSQCEAFRATPGPIPRAQIWFVAPGETNWLLGALLFSLCLCGGAKRHGRVAIASARSSRLVAGRFGR